jgi:uncharacterized protein (UPF0276 family)
MCSVEAVDCALPAPAICTPRKLGVGFPYLARLPPEFYNRSRLLNFVEIGPDTLCREVDQRDARHLKLVPDLLSRALETIAGLPVVVHGVELSIGSAAGWNESYLEILDQFAVARRFEWHSEHLGFLLAHGEDGRVLNTGVPLPVPFTRAALDVVVPRASALSRRYSVPFLLENTVYYLPDLPRDGGRDEIDFLNDLVDESGCGLLLDLFNLYCNGLHHGFDPFVALERLRLDRVVEIHIAGGSHQDGFLMDSHSELVPEAVWKLLEWVVPRTPNLAGILYELLDEAFANVGIEETSRQLERMQTIWTTQPTL